MSRTAGKKPAPLFGQLALFHFLLSQLGLRDFDDAALRAKFVLPGLGEDGRTNYCDALIMHLPENARISREKLEEYDRNIIRHTRHIGRKRGGMEWEYFQYLILLFAEIYLDNYFGDREGFRNQLNAYCGRSSRFCHGGYSEAELQKIALWGATGCGKTLLMHVNMLQLRHYAERARQVGRFNRFILLTPNDGMSTQHLEDLALSDIPAKAADGRPGLFAEVEVVSIHKIRDSEGKGTFAVESFENNNALFVDEGHRGAGGDAWRGRRQALCREGFCFEYSATFGQIEDAAIRSEYAKSIWFDYSYYRFYSDGYGKDYRIYNLSHDGYVDEAFKRRYLTACLMSFYRQVQVWRDVPQLKREFNIHAPLWAFVGSRVAIRGESEDASYEDPSDILQIVRFLHGFLADGETARVDIGALLRGEDGLVDDDGASLFASRFVCWGGMGAAALYADILRSLFNTAGGGGLRLAKLGGRDEIALMAGIGEPFGVINVGKAAEFMKACEKEIPDVTGDERHFGDSLFGGINRPDSSIIRGACLPWGC